MANSTDARRRVSRRTALLAGGGVAVAAIGTYAGLREAKVIGSSASLIGPDSPLVSEAADQRPATGRTHRVDLTPRVGSVTLAGTPAATWLYGGNSLPGPEIRLDAGDRLVATVRNYLPEPTTVHWHGIRIRNDMDGVPSLTQKPIAPGAEFTYDFRPPDPGTYWYHSHVGMQRDRGLYGPLIVTDPADAGAYDHDITVMIDDWLDGLGNTTPDAVYKRLTSGNRTGITQSIFDQTSPWGPQLGDVRYPMHLINGRPPEDPPTWTAKPGERLRLRLINAAADTSYRVALAGHSMTVVQADARPVKSVTVDTLLIGMGERYDVTVTLKAGVFPLVAAGEGRDRLARAIVRTGSGSTPPADTRPDELTGKLLRYADLAPVEPPTSAAKPDRTDLLLLSELPGPNFRWAINDHLYPHYAPVPIHPGERIRVRFQNGSAMPHPMHLHGHTFTLTGAGKGIDAGGAGVEKDTIVVGPTDTVDIDIDGDNPGQWLLHCHNAYHMMAGMATVLSYRS
jgi:FtsP/CotA-like multicopper oxidase with cupredoxin domain